ncbi:MAG: TetR family transcriptional regulator [Pseudomonadota bacterium]
MAAKSTKSKSNGKSVTDPVRAAIDAALILAADRPWSGVGLRDVAAASGLPLAEVRRHFGNRSDILLALARQADADVLAEGTDDLVDETIRDALFDLLMRRFDALAPYKPGLQAILDEARGKPQLILPVLPQLGRSMSLMLEAAGEDPCGRGIRPKIAAASFIWLTVLRKWLEDDTEDQAKTMAALDNALSQAETLANSFNDGPLSFVRSMVMALRPAKDDAPPAE